jgi:hypothetical protein
MINLFKQKKSPCLGWKPEWYFCQLVVCWVCRQAADWCLTHNSKAARLLSAASLFTSRTCQRQGSQCSQILRTVTRPRCCSSLVIRKQFLVLNSIQESHRLGITCSSKLWLNLGQKVILAACCNSFSSGWQQCIQQCFVCFSHTGRQCRSFFLAIRFLPKIPEWCIDRCWCKEGLWRGYC